TQHVVVCNLPPHGRLRRAKPSSPAQHHVKKLYLHRTPLHVRGTRRFSNSVSCSGLLNCTDAACPMPWVSVCDVSNVVETQQSARRHYEDVKSGINCGEEDRKSV